MALLWASPALCVGACGANKQAEASASAGKLPLPEIKSDKDRDSDTYPGELDNDENHVFGVPADVRDARSAAALLKRYYRAAAAHDGKAACAMMYSSWAESVAVDYGSGGSGTSSPGATCAAVMSEMFAHEHARLVGQSAGLRVVAVRVLGSRGSVQMRFGSGRQRSYMELRRERGAWKIDRLIGSERPIVVE